MTWRGWCDAVCLSLSLSLSLSLKNVVSTTHTLNHTTGKYLNCIRVFDGFSSCKFLVSVALFEYGTGLMGVPSLAGKIVQFFTSRSSSRILLLICYFSSAAVHICQNTENQTKSQKMSRGDSFPCGTGCGVCDAHAHCCQETDEQMKAEGGGSEEGCL